MVMKIGVVGASGYSGGELLRLLLGHPNFSLHYVAAGASAGESITSIHPHLTALSGRKFEETSVAKMNECDLLFFALPHGESQKYVSELQADIRVVDLGADYRLSESSQWEKYYGGSHAGSWVYGAPELPGQRELIKGALRIANPGCYATSINLAIAPAVTSKIIDATDIVVVAASGVTGAGRSAKINLLGAETMNSLTSYKFGGIHQHTPEIEQTLDGLGASGARISFTPILAPMPRGILATVTAKISHSVQLAEVRSMYQDFYSTHGFVTLLPEGELPRTSSTLGSNSVHLQVAIDSHTQRLIVSCALDNLGKGAASAALQNANLISGLKEDLGVPYTGVRA